MIIYRTLTISKDEDLEIHWKIQLIPALLTINFNVGLDAWEENVSIKLVFNENKALAYMCQYFSKTEDQCLQVIKQAIK